MRSASLASASASSASASSSSSSMRPQPQPRRATALLLPMRRISRAPEQPASKSRPRDERRTRVAAAAKAANDGDNDDDATSASTTVVVVSSSSGTSSELPFLPPPPPPPPPPPSAVSASVGTTPLDASVLPALDAAVTLPLDPSSSLLIDDAATSPPPAPSSPSSSSSSPFFSFSFFPPLPPAVSGMLAINLGAALFGSNMVAVKLAQSGGASPAALSAGRFALAAAVFLPSAVAALRKQEREKKASSMLTQSGVELGMWLFGGYTGQAVGLSMTSASRGAFAAAFTVLAVPVLQAVASASRRRGSPSEASSLSSNSPPASTWVAAAAAVAGVFLLTSDGGSSSSSSATITTVAAGPNLGDILCVLSAVLFGVHKWRSEILVERLLLLPKGGEGEGEKGGEPATARAATAATEEARQQSVTADNEDTVQSLVALQLCVLALVSVALCLPEATGAVKGALADQRDIFLSASSPPSSASHSLSSFEFSLAVSKQLWSQFAALPWALFAYMGLFT